MKKFLSNNIFWVLQFCGWSLFIVTIQFLGDKELSVSKYVYDISTSIFVIITATSMLRWMLKKSKFSLSPFTLLDFFKLFLSISIAAFIFYGLLELAEVYEVKFFGKEDDQLNYDFWVIYIVVFFFIATWTALYIFIKVFRRLNQQKIERLELNGALKEAQLNTLKGQINPHFMFNSLNNIRGLMLEDVEKSREMISKLSEMLQYALAKNTVDAIPLEEELEMVENYIALSKIQMEDRLHYVEEIAPDTLQTPIPPMIIQLLVENAAKHGIANLKDGGTISVKTKKENQNLFITVTNTGKLRIAKGSTQLGLKNIRQRLRLLHGQKATFSLEEKEGAVIANIKIPLS